MHPDITILISAHNAEKHIAECLESILNQSYYDFEVLILNDGSTDGTEDIAKSYSDARIRVICCCHNYINTLNYGIDLSRGRYIARMDADDIMHPDRLKIQFSLLEEAPEITLCATWVRLFDEDKGVARVGQSLSGLIENPILSLLERNFIVHPTAMIRKEFLLKNQIRYSPHYPYAEDYKLWVDVALSGAMFYIEPEPLLHYRVHNEQVSRKNFKEQAESAMRIQKEIIAYLLSREQYRSLNKLYSEVVNLETQGLISKQDVLRLMTPFIHKFSCGYSQQ